jgi:hypothetical protein
LTDVVEEASTVEAIVLSLGVSFREPVWLQHEGGEVGDTVEGVVANEQGRELIADVEVHERDEGGELEHVEQ